MQIKNLTPLTFRKPDMPKVPGFLLKALYVKGSLRPVEDGFEFQMKNDLGPARIVGARPLQLDRKAIPLVRCSFVRGGETVGFGDVTPEGSVLMHKGEAVTIQVAGEPLRPGRHTLGIHVEVKDMGSVRFSVSDKVGR